MNEDQEFDEQEGEKKFGKKFKHTLDSDEEDDEVDAEKYNIMDGDQIEGTEKSTIEFDGDIKITPFNMDEELETGHFDKEGTYIFEKETDIRDNWLDNINWSSVDNQKKSNKTNEEDEEEEIPASVNTGELYSQLVELMQPGESIQKAIQRYGKSCQRTKKGQKRKLDSKSSEDDDESNVAKGNMLKLISIADKLLSSGDMDIYERKFEELKLHLNKAKQGEMPDNDMFSDDFNSKASGSAAKVEPLNDEVQWEFKWEDKEDAPIYGPHSSGEMLAWVNQGYFEKGVFVRRKAATDSSFYSSKRIDFELYIWNMNFFFKFIL